MIPAARYRVHELMPDIAKTTLLYFAYGSNLLSSRLQAPDRAPSAQPVSIGYVSGRRLTFDKVGKDGSGKCDMEPAVSPDARVYGALYRIDIRDKPALDIVESLGVGYREEWVRVSTPHGEHMALAYTALQKEEGLTPYPWYRDLVLAGAVEHRLPPAYVQWLRAFPANPDPDRKRQQDVERRFPAICR